MPPNLGSPTKGKMPKKSSGPPPQLTNLSHKGSGAMVAHGTGSAHSTSFEISFPGAKVPQRTYSAELAFLRYSNGEVYFNFGQKTLMEDGLESVISLRMHGFFAKQFLETVRNMKEPGLEEIAVKSKIQRERLTDDVKENPLHIAKMSANIIQMGVSGHDTSLDFYQLSAISVFKAKLTKRADVADLIPIARVDLRTSLFLGIVDRLIELEPEFPGREDGDEKVGEK